MTVKQGVRKKIIKKTIILLCIAAVLGALCYFTSDHKRVPAYGNSHWIYNLVSIGISVVILIFVAFKIRYFHTLFGKEWTGTIVSVRRNIIRSAPRYGALMEMDELVMVVRLDSNGKKKKLKLPGNRVGENVYFADDRVYLLKGTRYPINLTREAEQHICPICGRDSCYGDECPDCNIKY